MDCRSECLLIILAPADVGMFRFLLEAKENLGYCTTLDDRECALKLVFAPGSRGIADDFLERTARTLEFEVREMPKSSCWNLAGDGTGQNHEDYNSMK